MGIHCRQVQSNVFVAAIILRFPKKMNVKKHSVRKGSTAFQTWKAVFLSVWIFLVRTKSLATASVTHVSVTQEKWSTAKRHQASKVIKI